LRLEGLDHPVLLRHPPDPAVTSYRHVVSSVRPEK
jgi:hypothetical protein